MSGTKPANMFQGLSLLRAEERKQQAQASGGPQNSALQDYLKRYTDGGGVEGEKKKRKKKKEKQAAAGGAIRIIDEDAQGEARARRPPNSFSDEEEDDDFRPVIANEAEAKLLVKQTQKAKEFYKPSADGSGWVNAAAPPAARPRHDSPDASPPRRAARHDSPDASPPRRAAARHGSPDASPPRRAARHDSLDASPPRRGTRHDSPDASPPRGGASKRSADASPQRRPAARARHDSPDASPPRRTARHDSPDASPPRRTAPRHDSPDASPPRRGGRHDSPDASPPRRKPAAAAADASPLRRAARHDSPDASPPRRAAARPDASPRRAAQRHDSPNASPPRARPKDASPPRRGSQAGRQTMADGTATGLVSAAQLKAETDRFKQEAQARRMAATGRGAETVYRDRVTGKAITKAEFEEARSKDKKKAKTKEEEEAEQHLEWRGGLAQRKAAQEIAARLAQEAAAPFARYEGDKDRDAMLKQRVYFGDPMAHLVQPKADEPDALTQRYNAAALQQSGFIIPQGVPPHSWLKRGVPAPGNRYNIRPGRHWDGVDRSNGFEKKMFAYQATVRHREKEAREWSMADM